MTTADAAPNVPQKPHIRVTVGLPVYNGARFVDRAISAIRRQTLADFELIIADNASTDETLEICRRHATEDARIRILTSSHNMGAAWNFNRIVAEASAELFKWAAHDDLIAPEFLERTVAVLDAEPVTVLCYPRAVDIDVDDKVIAPIHSVKYATGSNPVVRVRESLGFNTSCVEIFGVIRTSVLRRTPMIGAYTSSDRALLLELATHGRFHELDDVLLMRRQHESRSVRVTGRARNAWFDPSRAEVMTFPRWRLLAEYVRIVRVAPASRRERLQMALAVARWSARRWRRLGRELATWSVHEASNVAAFVGGVLPRSSTKESLYRSRNEHV